MRHRVAGKQLSRNTSHRRSLRRNQAASLFQHGAIRTTEVKAKELRRFVEKLITIARKGTLQARRRVIAMLRDREMFSWNEAEKDFVPEDKTIVQKLFDEIAPRYADRPGGYTRIIRLSDRRIGDSGVQVMLQLVEETVKGEASQGGGRRKQRAAKRHAAAEKAQTGDQAGEEKKDE
jgi:large subunit ribosomal protein L17